MNNTSDLDNTYHFAFQDIDYFHKLDNFNKYDKFDEYNKYDEYGNITYEYDTDIGEETIYKEYKVFSFNLIGIDIDNDDAIKLCESNYFGSEMNAKVVASIEKYFEYYPAKYLSGYFNTGISGKLLIGPDNWGYIKAIPYQGELDTSILINKFYSLLESKILNNNFTENIREYVKINFIKITYDSDEMINYIGKLHPLYTKYLENRAKYRELRQAQIDEYNNWKCRYALIQSKLVDLLNGFHFTRILIINYIKKISPDNPVIKLLESDQKIESLTHEEIALIVTDKNNPYYWSSEWKDDMCEILKKERPTFEHIPFTDFNAPYNLINSVSNMIPYWIANNPNINLYMIQIDYNYDSERFNNLGKWMYLDKHSNYISCVRIIKPDGEPANFPD
jgi:hypothetical protein